MSKKRPPIRRPIPLSGAAPVREALPGAVVYGARHMEMNVAARKSDRSLTINLDDALYRRLDTFTINDFAITVGAIDRARPRLLDRRVRQAFAFGHLLGSQATLSTVRLDRKTGKLLPVNLALRSNPTDGHLVYLPVGRALYSDNGNRRNANAFTTSAFILAAGEPSISFVTSDDSIKAAERAMAAGTEIMQNRFVVSAISLDDGSTHTSEVICQTYQESIANGAGNMLGAVGLGWTYRQYEEFLAQHYDSTPMHANFTDRRLLGHRTEIIAPHVMFDQDIYSTLADGALPQDDVQVIARRPVPMQYGQ